MENRSRCKKSLHQLPDGAVKNLYTHIKRIIRIIVISSERIFVDKKQIDENVKSPIYDEIAAYLDWCRDVRGFTPMTIRGKTYMLQGFVYEMRLHSINDLTNEAVDCFVERLLKRDVSPLVVNLRLQVIISWTRWMKESGRASPPLNTTLVRKLKGVPAEPRTFYTREEIEEVLEKTKDEMTWLLIAISFDTGIRLRELTRLRICEVHGARLNFLGKGQKLREVWLSARTSERFNEWIEKKPPHEEWVWDCHGLGRPYCEESLRTRMKAAFRAAGHPDFHPHALRHSFATDIQRRGADVMEIKEMMGHSSVATTVPSRVRGADARAFCEVPRP